MGEYKLDLTRLGALLQVLARPVVHGLVGVRRPSMKQVIDEGRS